MGNTKQLVFIDESGDPGFTFKRGSSKVFVIACVVFKDELEAEKCALAIKVLRRNLKFSDKAEFKFNGSRKKVRIQFLKTIIPFNFSIRALVVNKSLIRSPILKADKNSFYSYFIKTLLNYSGKSILNANLKIDGSGDKTFRKNFITYLRRELNSYDKMLTKNITLVDSRSNVLIQMADMIAGTTRRYKEADKNDANDYWDIIKSKFEDCWDFK